MTDSLVTDTMRGDVLLNLGVNTPHSDLLTDQGEPAEEGHFLLLETAADLEHIVALLRGLAQPRERPLHVIAVVREPPHGVTTAGWPLVLNGDARAVALRLSGLGLGVGFVGPRPPLVPTAGEAEPGDGAPVVWGLDGAGPALAEGVAVWLEFRLMGPSGQVGPADDGLVSGGLPGDGPWSIGLVAGGSPLGRLIVTFEHVPAGSGLAPNTDTWHLTAGPLPNSFQMKLDDTAPTVTFAASPGTWMRHKDDAIHEEVEVPTGPGRWWSIRRQTGPSAPPVQVGFLHASGNQQQLRWYAHEGALDGDGRLWVGGDDSLLFDSVPPPDALPYHKMLFSHAWDVTVVQS